MKVTWKDVSSFLEKAALTDVVTALNEVDIIKYIHRG